MINIEKIKKDAQKMFEKSKGSHDWDHTLRVYNLALHISAIENADLDVIKTATLLHDIARHEQDNSKGVICHAEKGGILAREYLEKEGYSEEFISRVVHCISHHRSRGKNIPETLEARILFDSDKLDGIGATGIGRSFLFAGEIHAKLHDSIPNLSKEAEFTREDTAYREYIVSLSKIKDKLFTKEAKRISEGRHQFMVEFFDRLNKEVDGII